VNRIVQCSNCNSENEIPEKFPQPFFKCSKCKKHFPISKITADPKTKEKNDSYDKAVADSISKMDVSKVEISENQMEVAVESKGLLESYSPFALSQILLFLIINVPIGLLLLSMFSDQIRISLLNPILANAVYFVLILIVGLTFDVIIYLAKIPANLENENKKTIENMTETDRKIHDDEIPSGIERTVEYYDGTNKRLYEGYLDENHDRTGEWVFYNEDGSIKERCIYKAGRLVK